MNTKDNPADIASRGCILSNLCNDKLRWHGPTWLLLPLHKWPETACKPDKEVENMVADKEIESNLRDTDNRNVQGSSEIKTESVFNVQQTARTTSFEINEQNYSSVSKLMRVTAWCQRFVNGIRGKRLDTGYLTSNKIHKAECLWQKCLQKRQFSDVFDSIAAKKPNNICNQLDIFIDEDGILRCGGRLKHANFSEATRFSILLPPQEKLTSWIIDSVHKRLLHSGVSQTLSEIRHQFRIPHGRATVRKVLKKEKWKVDLTSYRLWPHYPSHVFQRHSHFQEWV